MNRDLAAALAGSAHHRERALAGGKAPPAGCRPGCSRRLPSGVARAKWPHAARRPVSLLSGLLTCGCCGGRYGLVLRDCFGCLNHHRRGTCANARTIRREKIEQRVLSGLTDGLVSAESIAASMRAYVQETNWLNRERRAQNEADRRELDKIERAVARILAAIENDMHQPAMKARIEELEHRAHGAGSHRPARRASQHRQHLASQGRDLHGSAE